MTSALVQVLNPDERNRSMFSMLPGEETAQKELDKLLDEMFGKK